MRTIVVTFTLLILSIVAQAHGQWEEINLCGTVADPNDPQNQMTSYQLGGKEITAEGILKVPVVFIQFPDESTTSDYWPIGQEPIFMRTFIDSTTTENSTNYGNLTNFYRQMSMNRLLLIGKPYHFITRYNRSYYGNSMAAIHTEIIQRLDSLISFAEFDNWKYNGNYNHSNQADGKVDMMIMIHRTFEQSYAGIKTIGIYTPLAVDNGQRTVFTGLLLF